MGWIVGLAIAALVAVRAVERQIAFASGGMDGAVARVKRTRRLSRNCVAVDTVQ